MSYPKKNMTFSERLALCMERVGGKRAMATATLISESQMFRYINGDTDITREKLLAIAKAASVDAGWLMTGGGDMQPNGDVVAGKPGFRPELLVQVAQTFVELMLESDKTFTPRQRALAVTFIYEAMRIEETRHDTHLSTDKRVSPFYPEFLAPLRAENRLELYHAAMNALEYEPEGLTFQTLQHFDMMVKLSMLNVYDSAAGEVFFEKMGTTLLPEAVKNITQTVEDVTMLTGKRELDWLDAGCGNGRHLSFLSQHFPNLRLRGFEGSRQALHLCQQLVKAGKLPIGIVEEADFRSLPYESETMDVVYCRLGLNLLPYVPGHAIGAIKYLSEVKRVLRPGGIATMLTHEGNGRDYILFTQYHTEATVKALAAEVGLEIERIAPCAVNETGGKAGQDYSTRFDRGLHLVLRKPK